MLSMAVPAPTLNQGSDPIKRVEGSEAELVRRAQQGSAEAFEALFSLHWARAYRAAWLVVHDAAATAAQSLPMVAGAAEWTVTAALSGIVGLVVGAAAIPLIGFVVAPVWKLVKGVLWRPERMA